MVHLLALGLIYGAHVSDCINCRGMNVKWIEYYEGALAHPLGWQLVDFPGVASKYFNIDNAGWLLIGMPWMEVNGKNCFHSWSGNN